MEMEKIIVDLIGNTSWEFLTGVSPRTSCAFLSVTMVAILFGLYYYWFRKQINEGNEQETANLKKYSKNGVWVGEKIYIDPENKEGNVRKGFTFFHPITEVRYPCIRTAKAPKGEERSYVLAIYNLTNDNKTRVIYVAYLAGVPSYHYEDLGLG